MNWQRKARIQNVVASLPLSNTIYYAMQRTVGNLRPGRSNPLEWMQAAVRMVEWIKEAGQEVVGKRFLEVGTGRMINIPTALWLCGAAETVTVDLNPYLSATLVDESNQYLREHREEIVRLFGAEAHLTHFQERFEQLLSFKGNLGDVLKLMNVHYLSPGDAACVPFPDQSFDFHISHAVFEHIPADVIKRILKEARRVLVADGLLIHVIDPSDHFAHDDKSITPVNFLQFSDHEWKRWAGNQFMYHNRLRSFEYLEMFDEAGVHLLKQVQAVDEPSLRALKNGFPLHRQFNHITPEELAVTSLIVMGSFSPPGASITDELGERGRP